MDKLPVVYFASFNYNNSKVQIRVVEIEKDNLEFQAYDELNAMWRKFGELK